MQAELCLTFYWDVRKLWTIDLPIVRMRVQELEWLLAKPFWKDRGQQLALCPRDVAANRERYRTDYERAMAADLTYPIIHIYLRQRWVEMDGLHCLLKAWMCNHHTILTKQARHEHIPLFSRKPNEPSNHPVPTWALHQTPGVVEISVESAPGDRHRRGALGYNMVPYALTMASIKTRARSVCYYTRLGCAPAR